MTQAADAAAQRVRDDFQSTISRLQDLVRIPSCSFPGHDVTNLQASAEATADWFRSIGFPEVELLTDCAPAPYVLAKDHRAGPDQPTILLYAHHDVQPPLRDELWTTPAYEPAIRDGRMYGRGSADDKAGIAAHAAACAAWLAEAALPVNVTVLIEGEEEIGSPNLEQFVSTHLDKLQSDCVIIADLVNVRIGVPTLTVGLRGLCAMTVTLSALTKPLHSGMWGGPVPDPVMGLCRILATLTDQDGNLTVDGISWPEASADKLADIAQVPYTGPDFHRDAAMLPGAESLVADRDRTLKRLWYEPALTISAIRAGDAPAKAGNVIMDQASARVGLRVVPGQDPDACLSAIEAQLRRHLPAGMQLDCHVEASSPAWSTATDHPWFTAAKEAFSAAYGHDAVMVGCGASIPFVGTLCERLGGIPALLVPVEDPQTNAHAEDESVHLGDLENTAASLALLLAKLAR